MNAPTAYCVPRRPHTQDVVFSDIGGKLQSAFNIVVKWFFTDERKNRSDADLSAPIDNLKSKVYASFRPSDTGGTRLPGPAVGDGLMTVGRCDGCSGLEKPIRRVWGLRLCELCSRRANWKGDNLGLSSRVVVGDEWKRHVAALRQWLKRQTEVKR